MVLDTPNIRSLESSVILQGLDSKATIIYSALGLTLPTYEIIDLGNDFYLKISR